MFDRSALVQLGLNLPDAVFEQLAVYHGMLVERNQTMDLTTVPEEEMAVRHYADSLLVLNHGILREKASLIDVGTGAGFPGLPLAIARPGLNVTLLDSKQKRCDFLQDVVDALKLRNVKVLCGRAESLALPPHREAYDIAAARAVAPLNLLAEYLLPYVRVGGQALCWKGPSVRDELKAGETAANLLGGKTGRLIDLGIPGRSHYIQILEKVSPTPKKYPRKAGTPAREPLGL